MYDRILFPTDGSETASAVLESALAVAETHGATLYVLNVADTTRDSVTQIGGEVVDALVYEGERIVDGAAERARDRGVDVVEDVRQGVPAETIVAYAGEYDVDLVVMPTHGRSGVERVLLGSVTERVATASPVPVLTITPDLQEVAYPFRDVLVPTDGSDGADRALERGIELAAATGATLHLLHVVETASLGFDVRSAVSDQQLEERGAEILEAAGERAREAGIDTVTTTLAYGRPIREILSYADGEEVDVVAIGTHGETDYSRYALGGVSAKLIRTSPVPVLVVGDPGAE